LRRLLKRFVVIGVAGLDLDQQPLGHEPEENWLPD